MHHAYRLAGRSGRDKRHRTPPHCSAARAESDSLEDATVVLVELQRELSDGCVQKTEAPELLSAAAGRLTRDPNEP